MAMNDLFTALQMFNKGLKDLQTGRVLNNANEMVEQIRASDMDAKEKRAELKNIANQLTLKMVGLGGSVEQAKLLAEQFEGPKPPTMQTADQAIIYGMQMGDESILKSGLAIKEMEREAAIKKAEAEQRVWIDRQNFLETNRDENAKVKSEAQLEKERRSTLFKVQGDFQKASKDIREATRFARQGLDIINSDGPASKLLGAVQFAAVRAAGSSSQLSDKEREALAGQQDLLSQFRQLVSTKAKSEFIEENKEAFRDLFNVYLTSGEDFLSDLESTYVNQLRANPLFVDDDPRILGSKIVGRDPSKVEMNIPKGAGAKPMGMQQPGAQPQQPQGINIPGVTIRPR